MLFGKEERVASNSGSLLLYPNPATDLLTIDNDDYETGTATVRIISIDGKILQEQRNVPLPYRADIGNLPAGSYLIILQTATQSLTGKFIKQ